MAGGWLRWCRRRAGLIAMLVGCLGLAGVAAGADPARHPLAQYAEGSSATIDHSALDALLRAYVVASDDGINRVDFRRFRSEGLQQLKAYLTALQRQDPTRLGQAEHAAYFINLYNAATLDVVLEHYPVRSIKEVRLADAKGEVQDGPWKTRLVVVGGRGLTLDEIAGEILRPVLMKRDPRGHYLLNCLSLGCPNLLPEAITGARLEAQLARAAADFVRHPRAVSVRGGRVTVSSLYAWYEDDFGGAKGVLAHLVAVGGRGVVDRLEGATTIDADDYEWALVDVNGPVRQRGGR